MALSLKICTIKNFDCSQLCIKDTTGVYSPDNLGGWGVPNKTIANANFATITVSKRNSDGTYGTAYTINAYPTLPNTSSTQFCFTATQLGIGSTFSDGIYQIVYTVGNNIVTPWSSSVTQYKVFSCTVDCCYKKMADQVSVCLCGCEDLECEFAQIATFHRLLKGAECCGQLNSIQTYLDKLTKLCLPCGGCC